MHFDFIVIYLLLILMLYLGDASDVWMVMMRGEFYLRRVLNACMLWYQPSLAPTSAPASTAGAHNEG